MKFSLKLVEKNNDITKSILQALKKEVEKVIKKSLPKMTIDIKQIVKESLMNEPEYSSLKSGTLRAELGIANISDVDNVIDAMADTLNISFQSIKITNSGLSGGFTLTMIKSDNISGIISSDSANVIDKDRGYSLPWLEWLLLKGNGSIVQNYSVNYTNSLRSRSGMALMIESKNDWKIPTNFAGTIDNNWTTRAISKIESQIIKTIQNNIEDNI